MKKLFFSFVIATMMTSLMACGGKTEQNAASQDSTVVEAEAAEEAVAKEAVSNQVESEKFTGIVPEGWEIERADNGGFQLKNKNVEGLLKPTISVHKAYYTPAEAYESTISNPPKNLIGEVEIIEAMDIAGRTYAGYYYESHYNNEVDATKYYLITNLDNGTSIYVQVENIAINDADVQSVFASIKEK